MATASLSLSLSLLKFMKESLTSAPRSASCQNGRTDKGVDELNTKDRLLFRQTYLSNINSRDGRKKSPTDKAATNAEMTLVIF